MAISNVQHLNKKGYFYISNRYPMKSIILIFLLIPCYGQAQQWRLVEEVHQHYSPLSLQYTTSDSTRYIYNHDNDRGGLPDGKPINYDTKKYYDLSTGTALLALRHEQLFLPDNAIEVNTRYQATVPGGTLELSTADSFYYKNGRLDEQAWCKNAEGWGAVKRTMYVYDTAGNLEIAWTLGRALVSYGYTLGDRNCYSYDSQNRLIRDSLVGYTGTFVSKKTNAYIYDGAGLLVRNAWLKPGNSADTVGSIYYMYDANGRLLADSTESTYSLPPYIHNMHTYTYYPNGALHMDTTWNYPDGKAPRRFEKETEYFYDQNGLLTEVAERYYNNGSISSAKRTLYNYEIYWPNSVEEIQPFNNTISVFPVPSSGLLNITAQFAGAEEVHIIITDVQGRVLRSWTDKADKQYNKQIPVHGFVPGNYFVSFDTGAGRAARQFVVR